MVKLSVFFAKKYSDETEKDSEASPMVFYATKLNNF